RNLVLWNLVLWNLVLWNLVLWNLVLWNLVLWKLVLRNIGCGKLDGQRNIVQTQRCRSCPRLFSRAYCFLSLN
ncbi:MAG: hypothetical protein WB796_17500, partial [Candidatus Sulfotelmatobacter sp.]